MEELKKVYNYVTNSLMVAMVALAFVVMDSSRQGLMLIAAVSSVAFIIVTLMTVKVFASFNEYDEEEES